MPQFSDGRCDEIVCRTGLLEFPDEPAGDGGPRAHLGEVIAGAGCGEHPGAIGDQALGYAQSDAGGGSCDDRGSTRQGTAHKMIATSPTCRRSVRSSSTRL